jgi:ribosomal protein S18 acetylase RimI-like enzyme
MAAKFSLRPATRKDAVDLAILMDMASRGLLNWFWSTLAELGQSALEVGRDRILNRSDVPSHYSRWCVAEQDGVIAGGYAGYVVPEPYDPGDVSDLPDVYAPLLELEALAAGSWFLIAIAVYPEFRKTGLGSTLLNSAIEAGKGAGAERISLTVSTANEAALMLYTRYQFSEIARRDAVCFPASGAIGEWLLLERAV